MNKLKDLLNQPKTKSFLDKVRQGQPGQPSENSRQMFDALLGSMKGEPGMMGNPGLPGKDATPPTTAELLALIRPLIPKVKDGETPTAEQIVALIKPLIPKVYDGRTPTRDELIALIKPLIPKVKDGSPDKPEEVRNKLASLKGEDRLDASAIKNLPKLIGSARKGGGGTTVVTEDLSSQCDGSTRIFSTTKRIGSSIILTCTQFPNVLRPVVDYTASGTTVTINAALDPPASGQTLIFVFAEG